MHLHRWGAAGQGYGFPLWLAGWGSATLLPHPSHHSFIPCFPPPQPLLRLLEQGRRRMGPQRRAAALLCELCAAPAVPAAPVVPAGARCGSSLCPHTLPFQVGWLAVASQLNSLQFTLPLLPAAAREHARPGACLLAAAGRREAAGAARGERYRVDLLCSERS